MDDAGGDVDRLAGTQDRALTGDLHRELALDDVDRLGLTEVAMGRQRPPGRRRIEQQAHHPAGALGVEMDLGAHAAGHPDHVAAHGPMIADGASETATHDLRRERRPRSYLPISAVATGTPPAEQPTWSAAFVEALR